MGDSKFQKALCQKLNYMFVCFEITKVSALKYKLADLELQKVSLEVNGC